MFQSVIKVSCALVMTLVSAHALAAGDSEAGQAKAVTCVACHGVDGNSAVPTFPKLAGLGHKYLLKQMQDIRDGRRPVALMAGQVDNMSDQDLADIAAFYNEQSRTGGMADPRKSRWVARYIWRVLPNAKCLPALGVIVQQATETAPQATQHWAVSTPSIFLRSSKCSVRAMKTPVAAPMAAKRKIMRTTAFRMSDMEIEAVASYIAGLQPNP